MKKMYLPLLFLPFVTYADDGSAMDTPPKKEPHFIEYNNRMVVFDPFHQAYERIQPDAFYVGVEGWLAGAITTKDSGTFITEGEVRMGYNYFYNGQDHVTPFVGIGVFKDNHHKHHISIPAVVYGTLGFLYDHEFNSVVNLGFNLKGIVGGGVSSKHINWGNPVLGFDAALPLTFRFGHKRHWDFRIEPFDIFLRGSNGHANYFGGRSTLGYRF